jgi:hypothetical protein
MNWLPQTWGEGFNLKVERNMFHDEAPPSLNQSFGDLCITNGPIGESPTGLVKQLAFPNSFFKHL